MLNSLLPMIKCILPVVTGILLVFAFMFTQKVIAATIISRPIPIGGFASTEDEIRYVNDQPAEIRRNRRYRSWIVFVCLFSACLPLSYFIPAVILKVVLK